MEQQTDEQTDVASFYATFRGILGKNATTVGPWIYTSYGDSTQGLAWHSHGKWPIFKNGKPSMSMGHGFHGYVSHNQRVTK